MNKILQTHIKSETNQKTQYEAKLLELLGTIVSTITNKGNDNLKQEMGKSKSIKIQIVNQDQILQNQKYGKQILALLDPRDRVLLHPFNFIIAIKNDIIESKQVNQFDIYFDYEGLIIKIQRFMVEVCENVISISFNHLLQNKLNDREAKDYTAKNIMINLQSILRKSLISIQNIFFKYKDSQIYENFVKKLKAKLVHDADSILKTILENLAGHYPQAPATGGTAKMNAVIQNINRNQAEGNDFIYRNQIKMSDSITIQTNTGIEKIKFMDIKGKVGDYTEFIMKTLNKAINITQNTENDSRKRTSFEIFTQFNEKLFLYSQSKDLRDKLSKQQKIQYFENIFPQNLSYSPPKELGQRLKKEINEIEQRQLIQLRKQHKYLLGSKIPLYVKPYTINDLKQKKFCSKGSTILRIMTKWAECLEEIFEKPQQMMQRVFYLKDIHNAMILPNNSIRKQLMLNLREQYPNVTKQLKCLKRKCTELQSQYLVSLESGTTEELIKRFNETRTTCSKINTVLVNLMHQYLNILIHHLLKAGHNIKDQQNGKYHNINLVVFKVGDLMRSKFVCSESTFINVVQTLFDLDIPNIERCFKLVRIKNKLDQQDNNILINYLFLNKVQCQLQLSIQQPKEKEKKYYDFSHLAYELTRGMFGVIAECSIMVTQNDSMINASSKNENYYQPKPKQKDEGELKGQTEHKVSRNQFLSKNNIFICENCKKLKITQKLHQQSIALKEKCKNCLVGFYQQYSQPQMKQNTADSYIIRNYKYFKQMRVEINISPKKESLINKIILILSKKEKSFQPFIVCYHQREMRYFLLEVNEKRITCKFNSEDLYFIDITDKIGKQTPITQDFILLENKSTLFANQEESLEEYIRQFEAFRIIKTMQKTIQEKNQILFLSDDIKKNEIFIKMTDTNQSKLTFQSIKHIYCNNIKLTAIPKYLLECKNVRTIDFKNNNLKDISMFVKQKKSIFINLSDLDLSSNELTDENILYIDTIDRLEYLSLNSNCFTEIKLTALNQLIKLNLNRNHQLGYVELNNLTSLKTANICQNSKLRRVNLTKLDQLRVLELRKNPQLKEVEFKKVKSLEILRVGQNEQYDKQFLTKLTEPKQIVTKYQIIQLVKGQKQ